MRAIIYSGLALLLSTGCVTDATDDGDDNVDDVNGKADGPADGTLVEKYALDLTSTMKLEDTRESNPDKRFSTVQLRARALVTTGTTATGVSFSVKLCDIILPKVADNQPVINQDFIDGLKPLALTGAITDGTLDTDPSALVLGAKLADPLNTALPTDGSSSKVFDQDGDGKPGISINIPYHGDIFAAVRVKLALKIPLMGTVSTGTADITLDKAIYGDNIFLYDAVQSAKDSEMYVKLKSATNVVTIHAGNGLKTCNGVRRAFP